MEKKTTSLAAGCHSTTGLSTVRKAMKSYEKLTSGPSLLVEDPDLEVPCEGVHGETGDLIVGQVEDM